MGNCCCYAVCCLCCLVICCFRPRILNFLLHIWHVVSFVFCCCGACLFCNLFVLSFFFLIWVSRLYSVVVASFLLGLVYLSLYPSLLSLRTAKHEFS